MKNLFLIALAVALLVGCGGSAPKCSDSNVQKTVLDISEQEMKNGMAMEMSNGRFNYEGMKSQSDSKPYRERIDKLFPFKLTEIRTNKQDDKVRKCECAANIVTAQGTSLPITYHAQYTDKNEVYVEVFGLK